MKASHCDECNYATVKWYEYKGPPAFDMLTCAKGHKPRHYMPRNAMDTSYGWKRVCGDFERHNYLQTVTPNTNSLHTWLEDRRKKVAAMAAGEPKSSYQRYTRRFCRPKRKPSGRST